MTHQSTPMHCALDWLGKSALTLAVVALALYLWAAYLERPWLSYQALPWEVIEPVHPGEAVRVVVLRCNDTSAKRTYRVTRTLQNVDTGEAYVLPASEVDIEPGCHREVSRLSVVPKDAAEGTYVLGGFGLAKGRLIEHRVPWSTQRFEVVR